MLIVGNGRLLTRDAGQPFVENGAAAAEGGTIAAVGETRALRARWPKAEFLDARGGLIMPGLINAHTHLYSALARGLALKGYRPGNFREVLEGLWWKLDAKLTMETVRMSARATLMDCVRQGVTTVFDHHASYGEIEGTLETIAQEAETIGIRTSLCFEVSDRAGEERARRAIAENAGFIDSCARRGSPLLHAMFGLHALFTLSDRTLEACAAANGGRAGWHLHLSESRDDPEDAMGRYGLRPAERLRHFGMLDDRSLLIHCVHVDEAETDLIRDAGTAVVNNPESNLLNAVGCAPVLRMIEKGITVGLGTDACTNDMLQSLRAALAAQRWRSGRPDAGFAEAAAMLFTNNPALASKAFGLPLGILRTGAAADIVVMDYRPYTPFGADNADGHLLFGAAGPQCRAAVIHGAVRMLDGKLVGIDEEKTEADITEAARKLWRALDA